MGISPSPNSYGTAKKTKVHLLTFPRSLLDSRVSEPQEATKNDQKGSIGVLILGLWLMCDTALDKPSSLILQFRTKGFG